MITAEDEARFWARLAPPNSNGCRRWMGALSGAGYGMMLLGGRKWVAAHRFACELRNGPPAQNQVAMHECDVPACAEPTHLSWGSSSDNAKDAIAKGRMVPPTRSRK